MRMSCSLIAVTLMFLLVGSGPAGAQVTKQRTDPDASSPAGVIYAIPLDSARQDAAPARSGRESSGGGRGDSSGSGSGTGASGTGSGTSGNDGARTGGAQDDALGDPGAAETAGGTGRSSIHSSNGFGSEATVPEANSAAAGGGSSGGALEAATPYALLGLLGSIGAALGFRVSRTTRL
jgi:hypothetical protein